MFAVIQLGGKQYLVKEKDVLMVEKLDLEINASMKIPQVLLISDGKSTKIGTPYLSNANVEIKLLENGRNDKVVIFKMKSKKRYSRLRGHRQHFSKVEVIKISA